MEPYDDERPFPPEWENIEKEGIFGSNPIDLLENMLRFAPAEIVDNLIEKNIDAYHAVINKFAALSDACGISSYEKVVTKKNVDGGSKGFHASIRVDLCEESIKRAGMTLEEVDEVWTIYVDQFKNFFESIKTQNIDGGFAH